MISAVRRLQGMRRRYFTRAGEKFFNMTELFNMSAKDWLKFLNELESLPAEVRESVLHGRDDEYGRGYE